MATQRDRIAQDAGGAQASLDASPVPDIHPARFTVAAASLGATAPTDVTTAAATELIASWSGPDRGYHSVTHLAEVLHLLDVLGNDDPAVELAAWFHDAEYSGLPGEDEAASADRAIRTLTRLGVAADATQRVAALVLVTIDHVPAGGDEGAALLCDADLAILAATPARYADYVAGVRRDYAHVPDDAFTAGRAAILRTLLRRTTSDPGPDGPLFRTQAAREWTRQAAQNLATELGRPVIDDHPA